MKEKVSEGQGERFLKEKVSRGSFLRVSLFFHFPFLFLIPELSQVVKPILARQLTNDQLVLGSLAEPQRQLVSFKAHEDCQDNVAAAHGFA